jgi:superfamily II DNA or RNA helicase
LLDEAGRFPTGLIWKLGLHRTCQLVDERKSFQPSLAAAANLPEGKSLRWYQKEAVQAFTCMNPINGDMKLGIIESPPGSGKTYLLTDIIAKMRVTTLVVIDSETLLDQLYKDLRSLLSRPIGRITSQSTDLQDVTIGMVKTIASRFEGLIDYLNSVDLLVVDECHMYGSKTFYKTIMGINAPMRCGLSGTPTTDDPLRNLKIEGALGPIIYKVPIQALFDEGTLARPIVFPRLFSSDVDLETDDYTEVYEDKVVFDPTRLSLIVEDIRFCLQHDLKTLILVSRENHGTVLQDVINDTLNTHVEFVWHGTSKAQRAVTIKAFKDNAIRILIGSGILNKGFNVPDIKALLLAGAEKSEIQNLQKLGRGDRAKEDGSNTFILCDYIDQANKYALGHGITRLELFNSIGAIVKDFNTPLRLEQ